MSPLYLLLIIAATSQQIIAMIDNENKAENSGTSVASGLLDCYSRPELVQRDDRLPSTINVLIDLIRQAEDSIRTQDARRTAIQLIHRFRQDGIVKTGANSVVLPYAPRGNQHAKNKIILNELVPGDNTPFPNASFTPAKICGLHFMLSNSIAREVRGDEYQTCKLTGQYRRRTRTTDDKREPLEESVVGTAFNTITHEVSDCPIENGVIYTRWGDIQGGTILTAIAAGLETQNIQTNSGEVDSRYAVTLAGDLVEVALHEGIKTSEFTIGTPGGWKSVLAPHSYYMDSQKTVYLTNPELRADMDGLILAMNVRKWVDTYRSLKVSQLLDMYYSNRGVFNTGLKACNRNKNFTTYTSNQQLLNQVKSFGYLYDKHTTLDGTPTKENIDNLVERAVQKFEATVAQISDTPCNDNDLDRTSTDLIIVLDTNWKYENVYPSLAYILDNLDINKYDSSYTVINATDGQTIVNLTTSLANFQPEMRQMYNQSYNSWSENKFNPYRFMDKVARINQERITNYKQESKMGGKSSTVLIVTKSTESSQGGYIQGQASSIFDTYYPDTHFIVLGTSNRETYNSYVRNPSTDIFTIPETTNRDSDVIDILNSVVLRLRQAPRRIVNPRCDHLMTGDTSSNDIQLYVEPGTTNYYKISQNYLTGVDSKSVKLRGSSSTPLTLCTSTSEPRPRSDNTECDVLDGNEKEFDLSSGSSFYFSVRADLYKSSINNQCSDEGCRFPDNVKFTVHVEGLTCSQSSGSTITSSLILFITTFLLYYFKFH